MDKKLEIAAQILAGMVANPKIITPEEFDNDGFLRYTAEIAYRMAKDLKELDEIDANS